MATMENPSCQYKDTDQFDIDTLNQLVEKYEAESKNALRKGHRREYAHAQSMLIRLNQTLNEVYAYRWDRDMGADGLDYSTLERLHDTVRGISFKNPYPTTTIENKPYLE